MFSKKERYLIRDKLHRSINIKLKLKLKLKKSLLNNNTVSKTKRLYLNFISNKGLLVLRKRNVCLLSGENNSINKQRVISRFRLNSLSISNKLQNFKINSW